MPINHSPNPYQVTFLTDEMPVDGIRFVRRKPKPCKLAGSMIRSVTRHTFRRKIWRFVGLGLLQLVLVFLGTVTAMGVSVILLYGCP
ncbi:MAG: hypothetical protein FWD31_01750 [Planctomycetaceae bacterium]|nr:hypothetical protein [Planctomycetaceae bacterium]